MKAKIIQALDACMVGGTPAFLWDRGVVKLIGSMMDPTDVGGIPIPPQGGAGSGPRSARLGRGGAGHG